MHQTQSEQTITTEKNLVCQLTKVEPAQITFIDEGWTSRVYTIGNGRIVFKFPRNDAVKKEYVVEIEAYQLVSAIDCQLSFPKVKWVGTNYNYLGYEGVIGTSLDQTISSLSVEEKRQLGTKLGVFLKQLHQHDLDQTTTKKPDEEIKTYQGKFNKAATLLSSSFSAEEFDSLHRFVFEAYPTKLKSLPFDPMLCHGDLGYWNMIYADQTLGIIDFGDIGYYDRSIDFAGMSDPEMLDAALKAYGNTDALKEKVVLRILMLPLIDLHFFIEKKDQDGIQKYLKKIKSYLPQYSL